MAKEARAGGAGVEAVPRTCPGDAPQPVDLKLVSVPWMENVVLVCGDCGKGRAAKKLRKKLEGGLERRGLARKARVITVGCFGICPKGGKVSVLLPGGACAVVDPVAARETLLRCLEARIAV